MGERSLSAPKTHHISDLTLFQSQWGFVNLPHSFVNTGLSHFILSTGYVDNTLAFNRLVDGLSLKSRAWTIEVPMHREETDRHDRLLPFAVNLGDVIRLRVSAVLAI